MNTCKLIVYLIIAFAWSWVNWFIGLHRLAVQKGDVGMNQFVTFFYIGVYGPAISAVVTTICFGGWKGVLDLAKRFTRWKAPLRLYIFIIFFPLLLLASGLGFYAWFYGPIGVPDNNAWYAIPGLLWTALFAGPLGEELGWRGVLLPGLQEKYTAFVSSLVVGIIWYCWHIPLFFAPFGTLVSGAPLEFIPLFIYLVVVVCLACINTWLFNNSRGSIFIAILMHLSVNAGVALLFFPGMSDHYKFLYLLSTPLLSVTTLLLGWKTRFNKSGAQG